MLEGEKEEFGAFVGYAPVLEALAVFFVSERNGMKRLRETQVMSSGIAVFNKIVEKSCSESMIRWSRDSKNDVGRIIRSLINGIMSIQPKNSWQELRTI